MMNNSNKTMNGFHPFTIIGYSRIPIFDKPSSIFLAGGYTWKIYFSAHELSHVSVYVALHSNNMNVNALIELTLLDQSGKGMHKVHHQSTPFTFKCRGQQWGYTNLMTRQSLELSDYLKNDCLILLCKVEVVKSCMPFTNVIPPPEMEQNIKSLFDTKMGYDIVFRVKDDAFKAHKLILASRSRVFCAQFYGLVGNPTLDEVELKDIEPPIFKAMLTFIYSDKLPDSQEIKDSMSISESTNMIQHLLVAADRFDLNRLKRLCEAKLGEELNVETVATTLSLAHQHNCSQLKAFCLDFLVANLKAVVETEGYKYVEKECPLLLSELIRKIVSQGSQG